MLVNLNLRYTKIDFVSQLFVHRFQLTTRVVFVARKLLIHRVEQHFIVDFSDCHACFVHDCDNSLVRRLDQITDDLIVEILNVRPLDAFTHVLLLFLLEDKFNEQLLKLLVAIINAVKNQERIKTLICV
jgi:hypothetical protein